MADAQGLGTGLATLVHALDSRKIALLEDLRRIEQDLEATRRTLDAAERMGFGTAASSSPATGRGTEPPIQAVGRVADDARRQTSLAQHQGMPRGADVIQMPGRPIPTSPTRDFEMHREALSTLGPVRKDKDIPPKIDVHGKRLDTMGMPTGGAELAAIKDSLSTLADKVTKQAPGRGERRYKPVGQMVPGEAMAPTLRNILKAADRPLTTAEITAAFLQVRKLQFEGNDLIGFANRVSSFLGQEAGRKLVKRQDQESSRQKLWTWVGEDKSAPFSVPD